MPTPPGDDDPLPEFDELTPELMEDESLRGDFMLRWAVVLLALLLGWVYVTESRILVDIRSGQHMLSHGFLPPRTDVFSATAYGLPWVNLSWLSDIVLGAVEQSLGFAWLSVLCALVLAGAFWCLGRAAVPGFSTWWGSVCSALALVAVFPLVQPGPQSWTILGLALLVWILAAWSANPAGKAVWGLPVLFLFWANLSAWCWLGLLLLMVFTVGASLRGKTDQKERYSLALSTLVALPIGVVASPWPGRPAVGFRQAWIEGVEARGFGGLSEFFPALMYSLKDRMFWLTIDQFGIVALVLMVIALVSLVLNFRRHPWGWVALWLAANGVAVFLGPAVFYAALVNAAVATWNGQDWYRNRFSLEYSIDTWSVVWARAGRALCVLSLFFVAYLAVNGALMGAQGRRIGMGLDPRWQTRIESLNDTVLPDAYGEKFFPTTPAQGDLLIWLGYEPFLDSRLSLYRQEEDLLALYRTVRTELFLGSAATAEETDTEPEWKKVLERFEIAEVLVRLWGPLPPYEPMLRLLSNRDWTMTSLGAAGALFLRTDLEDEEMKTFAESHRATRFSRLAFQPERKPRVAELPPTWPAAQSSYDRWLIQKLEVAPASAQLAAHYEALLSGLSGFLTPQQGAGLALMAIHNCREALQDDANQPLPYRVLGSAYSVLQQIEQQAALAGGSSPEAGPYDPQIIAAAFSAVKASGGAAGDLMRLYQSLAAQQELDTAREVLGRLERALNESEESALPEEEQQRLNDMRQQLDDAIHQVQVQVDEARAQGAPRGQLVGIALQGRCPSLALSLLREDLTELTQAPDMQLLYSTLLLRTGNLESAWEQAEVLSDQIPHDKPTPTVMPLVTQWRMVTGSVNACVFDVSRSLDLWEAEQAGVLRQSLNALLQQPFASAAVPPLMDLWPAIEARLTASAAVDLPERWGQIQLQRVRGQLFLGRLETARELLEDFLERAPLHSQRPVAVFYLNQLSDREYPVAPEINVPEEWIDPLAEQPGDEPPPVPLPQRLE